MRPSSPFVALALATLACRDAAPRAGGDTAADRHVTTAASPCGNPPAPTAADTIVGGPHAWRALPVNRGTHGMAARVRWTASADRCALLVVEDPAAVEAEPVPNGFLLASERLGGRVEQRDSVWDVAPSPDWTRVAYGRAYGLQGRERDSIPPAEWAELARRIGLPVDVVRRGAFVSSGMSLAYGVSRPVVVDLESGEERALATTGGWRMAWTRDGGALVLGNAPSGSQDFSPPSRWDVVDLGTPAARSASERARSLGADVDRAPLSWTDGPTIDISSTPPAESAPIAVDGGRVESRGGVIRLTSGAVGDSGVVIGPGVALAATRSGAFVAALAPDPQRREHDPPVRLVVYRRSE